MTDTPFRTRYYLSYRRSSAKMKITIKSLFRLSKSRNVLLAVPI